jgi:hypothetical protein
VNVGNRAAICLREGLRERQGLPGQTQTVS